MNMPTWVDIDIAWDLCLLLTKLDLNSEQNSWDMAWRLVEKGSLKHENNTIHN